MDEVEIFFLPISKSAFKYVLLLYINVLECIVVEVVLKYY
jgi:hypothetical protein